MSIQPLAPVVSTEWLQDRLGSPRLAILDASWYLPNSGRKNHAEYLSAHIPGARFFDLDAASDRSQNLPHMLPSETAFAAFVSALGIAREDRVIVYDGSGNNLSAARVWWMFRVFGHAEVAVLDGGLGKWKTEGRTTESGEPTPATPTKYQAALDASQVRSMTDVQQALAARSAQVVDLRSQGRFTGRDPEPRPGLPSGHMPGAINLPFMDLVTPAGTVLDTDALKTLLDRIGLKPGVPIIATCGSGTTACNLVLALERLGHRGVAVYDGSWTEWASKNMPIERT